MTVASFLACVSSRTRDRPWAMVVAWFSTTRYSDGGSMITSGREPGPPPGRTRTAKVLRFIVIGA
jgi:hypothetical protein